MYFRRLRVLAANICVYRWTHEPPSPRGSESPLQGAGSTRRLLHRRQGGTPAATRRSKRVVQQTGAAAPTRRITRPRPSGRILCLK